MPLSQHNEAISTLSVQSNTYFLNRFSTWRTVDGPGSVEYAQCRLLLKVDILLASNASLVEMVATELRLHGILAFAHAACVEFV